MLRRKLFIINLVFAIVLLAITVGGAFLLMNSIDRNVHNEVDLNEVIAVKDAMTELTESDIKNAKKAQAAMPQGYELVWVDGNDNLLVNTGLEHSILEMLHYKARQAAFSEVSVYNGIVVVVRPIGDTTLYAVKSEDNYIPELNRNMAVYLGVMAVVLLSIFIGSILVEMQVIFPRLKRLQEAMAAVYDGNYEQTLRVPTTRRRDEITTLLVEFDMLRRKLQDATLAKEAADRERGIVVSGISHDLRTPLTVIKTHAKGLLDGVAKRVGKEDEYIANIYSTALEMEQLVAKLADFTKVERRQITYSFMVRDVGELIQQFVDKHFIAYAARGLSLKCKVPKNKKLWVNIDRDQFNRVWQNLCDNSLKYKVKPEANVLIEADLMEDIVVIRVSDDGPGIAEYEV